MNARMDEVLVRSFAVVLALLAVGCGDGGRAADSARAAQHADSIRQLGAAAWSDGQLIAYVKVVSSTFAGDAPVVNRRARSRAVRAFGQRMTSENRRLAAFADSLESRRGAVAPPLVSSEQLRAHETEMRRLAQGGAFDLAFVKSARATLEEASTRLAKGDSTRHPGAVGQLLTRARTALDAQLKTARELERNLTPVRKTGP